MFVSVVTVTGTTTVFAPQVSAPLQSKQSGMVSKVSTGTPITHSTKPSITQSGNAALASTTLLTQISRSQPIATSSGIPPLPSGWPKPTPVPVDSKLTKQNHNNAVAIMILVFLVLLGAILISCFVYIVIQKMKGNCSKCKSLQDTVDKYARGELVPITKDVCKERESWLAEQEATKGKGKDAAKKKKSKKRNMEETWSLGFNYEPKKKEPAQDDEITVLPIGHRYVPTPPVTDGGPSRPASNSDLYADPYPNKGMQNPYTMRGIPDESEPTRTFATYAEHQNKASRYGEQARPDRSQPYMMERVSDESLAMRYRQACFDLGNTTGDAKGEAEMRRDRLHEQLRQERRRSRAYGGFSPIAEPLAHVDLEAQNGKKTAWKSLLG